MAVPNHALQQMLKAWLQTETVKVLLVDDSTSYSYDPAAHEFVDDIVTANGVATEMSGTGYSRKTLATSSGNFIQDDTDNEGVYDAADVSWSGLNAGTIQAIVCYLQVGSDDTTPGDDPVIAVLDDDTAGSVADLPLTTNGSSVDIQWAGEGIVNISG